MEKTKKENKYFWYDEETGKYVRISNNNIYRELIYDALSQIKNMKRECKNCGELKKKLPFHHIVPLRYGGRNTIQNITILCTSCHSKVNYEERVKYG